MSRCGSASDEVLHVVEIVLPVDDSLVVEEALGALGLEFATWRLPGSTVSTIRLFAALSEEAAAWAELVAGALESWGDLLQEANPSIQLTTIRREEWSESWKAFFRTFKVSSRLVVSPSWELYTPSAGEVVVELDPGMCFGTGYHGTTRACLEFLDELADGNSGASFLEAGCGSGILSLAARKLGFGRISAFDHDPDAVRVAGSNLAAQGVHDVVLSCADIAAFEPGDGYAVVAANILATVLDECAESVTAFMDRGTSRACLILSGILTEQYDWIRSRYEALGLAERQRRTIDEWTSGLYVRK